MKPTKLGKEDYQICSRQRAYNGFFKLDRVTLKHRLHLGGWSPELTRELMTRGDAVGVLMVDPDREVVVLVEQFRVGAIQASEGPWILELVAGVVEQGESPEDVAVREAREESGVELSSLERITSCILSPGGCDEMAHLFYAEIDSTGVDGVHGLAEEGEDIAVVTLSLEEAFAMLDQHRFVNATVIIALQWLRQKREVLNRSDPEPVYSEACP